MLILARKKGQAIRIGSDITITVVDIQGDQVRLGIDAPRHIAVLRQELYRAVKDANAQAAQAAGQPDALAALEALKNLSSEEKRSK